VVIEWSRWARTDIRDLKAYIAKDSPYYARRFTERIIAMVSELSAQRPSAIASYVGLLPLGSHAAATVLPSS